MPRPQKFEDFYERTVYSGKIFMYCTPGWDTLFPIVDIIRSLHKNTIISSRNGKGQEIIRTYGSQYNHCVLRDDLFKQKDYLSILKRVKCVFLFTNENDYVVTNVLKTCTSLSLPSISYSMVDEKYHFKYLNETSIHETAELTLEKMYSTFDLIDTKKIAELFPDFEIIDPPVNNEKSTLDKCVEKLGILKIEERKKKDLNKVQLFDPHLARIKKMERDRVKVEYPDDPEKLNVNVFSEIFKNRMKLAKKNNS